MPDHAVDHTPPRANSSSGVSPSAGRPKTRTRAHIIDGVADAFPGLSRTDTRGVMETVLEEVAAALIRGDHVKVRGFGHFTVREKRERIGRNPRTGIEVPITPRRVLTFKASPVLVDKVNGLGPDGVDADSA